MPHDGGANPVYIEYLLVIARRFWFDRYVSPIEMSGSPLPALECMKSLIAFPPIRILF